MTDNSKKQTPVTLEQIRDLLIEFRDESRTQNEQIIFKLETVLTRHGNSTGQKKPVVKKTTGVKKDKGKDKDKDKDKDKALPKTFTNTMYWWIALYAVQDPFIEKCFTPDDVVKAEESITGIKDKPDGYDRRRATGVSMWKGFPKSKKSGELKTMFDNWKKGQNQLLAMDVETEKHTDDESDGKDPDNIIDVNEDEDE